MSSGVKFRFNPESLSFERVKVRTEWKKKVFRLIIISALAYFVIGILLVKIKVIHLEDYLTGAAIVGGVASVSGLFTFSSSKLRRSDIEEIGIEYFKDLIKSAEQLKEKENDIKQKESILSAKEKELKNLELEKAELEFVVRKVSMSIFLQDQYERLENKIIELMQEHKELTNLIGQREHLKKQLTELGEELKSNEISETVQEIVELMRSTQTREKNDKTFFELLSNMLMLGFAK